MAKYYYTSDEILKSVKRRIVMPTSQNLFSDQDILDFATEEMNMAMVPMVLSQQEDYYLFTEYITLIGGKNKYPIPYRATGNKLREISYQSTAGSILEMTRITVDDLPFYNQYQSNTNVYAYYIANNEICIVPENASNSFSGQLRLTYYMRTNSLVPSNEVAIVSSIDRNTGAVVVSSIPDKFFGSDGNLVSDLQIDFVMQNSPHKIINYDISVLSADRSAMTITFDSSNIPASLSKGDRICLATESDIPQIPSDLHVMLAHRTSARVLEAIGDTEGLQNANVKLAEFEKRAADLIDDRVESSPKKVTNRHALMRRGLTSRRFRG
jgi:hypothetical protein